MVDEELDREYGMPVAGVWRGDPIPDLRRIAKSDWPEVFATLTGEVERHAINTLYTLEERAEAQGIALMAPRVPAPRRLSASYVAPPEARPPPRRGRQVNVRLYDRDHTALIEASKLAGTTATELARWMVVSGTRRMLMEDRRARAGTRGQAAAPDQTIVRTRSE